MDVEAKLVLAAEVTPANRPEGEASRALFDDVYRQRFSIEHLHIDRAYLVDDYVLSHRFWGTEVHAKAFAQRNDGRFTKGNFTFDFERSQLTCPAGESTTFIPGTVSRFSVAACRSCPLREQCTASTGARSVSVHREEQMLVALRQRQKTAEGRATLRRRTAVEHRLAAVGRSQGRRARYRGIRKNLYDVRRHGAIANLHVAATPMSATAA